MRFENKSSKLLSITKSKAKMYEFGLDEEHHIHLTESPSKLLLMTIGILGDLCREELSTEKNTELYELRKLELRNVARYFDALIHSKLQGEYDYYLCLLGAVSYYLADMPGSSAVLSRNLAQYRYPLTESGVEFLLEYVLNFHDRPREVYVNTHDSRNNKLPRVIKILATRVFSNVPNYLNDYFYSEEPNDFSIEGQHSLIENLVENIIKYFSEVGSDRELLVAQMLAAVLKRRISNSTKSLLPKYSGLDWSNWFHVAQKSTFIRELWPAQRLLGEAGVFKGKSAVVQLPTSAGKTKSAELIIRCSFLSERSSVAVIIAPYKSLCREISDSLSLAFKDENVSVNQLNDVPQIDEFDVKFLSQLFENFEDESVSPSIVVATPEKLVYLLRHNPDLAEAISLVIYDEGHQFDTGSRGVTYELLLTSLKQKLRPETQHVLISAVLSNAASIGEWLYAGEGAVINGSECLSTERSVAFSSWRRGLGQFHYVEPLNPNSEEFFVPRVLESFPIPLSGRERIQKYFPNKSDKTSIAAYLALKLSQLGPVAVFCGTKSTVASICKLIVAVNERLPELPIPRTASDTQEIDKIANLASMHLGPNVPLVRAIEKGVLPHSAGIPNGLRVAIEYAIEHGLGQCVICTSTLAQGVNLPIKYLVVSGVFQGLNRISTRDFHNLLGRAGRSGKHTEGSIIFTDTELYDERRSSKRWHWDQMRSLLDPSQSEHCSSSLLALVQPFQNDQLGVDPIKFLEFPDKYQGLVKKAIVRQGDVHKHLLEQMDSRRAYIKSLESFVLANADARDLIDSEIITALYTQTFAYSLASDDEKQKLAHVFNFVASRVNLIEPQKRSYYGKALLGLEELGIIEKWLHENIEALSERIEALELLETLWGVIKELASNNSLGKLIGGDFDLVIAKLWCSGVSYYEILEQAKLAKVKFKAGTQERELTIENIIDICDRSLGYDAMLIVGACADLLENIYDKPEIAEAIRQLQTSLKTGLLDELAIWLYSRGVADRIIAKDIMNTLKITEQSLGALDESIFEEFKGEITQRLSQYPSVFYNSVYG